MVVDARDKKVRAVRILRRVRINHPSPVDGAMSLLTFNGDANCPCRRPRRSAASCERGEDFGSYRHGKYFWPNCPTRSQRGPGFRRQQHPRPARPLGAASTCSWTLLFALEQLQR